MTTRTAPSADELLAHADWLHRLARVLVGDASADDVVQDTYAVAITRPPVRDGELRPWLGGVARNIAKMARRSSARRAKHEERAAGNAAITAPVDVPSSDVLLERARTHQRVAAIVLELPETLRDVLLLRFFEGMSAADIARAQNIPGATVRSRLADALARVRDALDADHDGQRNRWVVLLSPLPTAMTASKAVTTAALAGGMLVKLKIAIGVVVIVLAVVFGTRALGWWGRTEGAAQAVATTMNGSGAIPTAARPTPAAPPLVSSADTRRIAFDYEPAGALRLEGQVIDENDQPVGGAKVTINTAGEPRTTLSEPDGSFAFDQLIPRTFEVFAASATKVAGPANVRLTATSEPVTLRLREGGSVEVTVSDARSGQPVSGAAVELRGSLVTLVATADASGTAKLVGVPSLWAPVVATAPGYAPAAVMVGTSGDPASPARVALQLRKGVMISGRVLDAAGAPIKSGGVRVMAVSAADPFPVFDMRHDGIAVKPDGTYSAGPVAPGTWRVAAEATGKAPASSAPVTVEGERDRTGVDIRFDSEGGRVTGTVLDAAGAPVSAAEVKIVVRGTLPWRSTRVAVTDDKGAFRFADLPRREADIVAAHDTGSSELVPVNLFATRDHTVALTLAVTGAITGTVVDGAAQPIGDAQVVVEPVWSGGTEDRATWRVRGPQLAITDQGGAFRVAGLPDGNYTVRAARPAAPDAALELAPPVAATVTRSAGAPLTIVLAGDGTITGKVALADGSAPGPFTISLGGATPIPFATPDGTFTLPAIAGTHALVVDSRKFLAAKAKDVTVVADKVSDVGTITVQPGRSVRGRVLDEAGVPIAGATVAAGALLTGGGAELYIPDESVGAKDATTDEHGAFTLEGFSPAPITIVAGKEGVGRSPSIRLPAGPDSATLDLVVRKTTGLEGVVTRDGKPLADAIIIANPIGASQSNFFVTTGADGTFVLDALAPGEYVVFPMIGGGGPKPKDLYVRKVDVVAAAARSKVEIDATPGPHALTLTATTDAGQPVPAAMIIAVGATISPATAMELRDIDQIGVFGAAPIQVFMRAVMGGPVEIAGVRPGPLTICALPPPSGPPGRGEPDPRIACTQLTVSAATKSATLTIPASWFAK